MLITEFSPNHENLYFAEKGKLNNYNTYFEIITNIHAD